MKLYVVFSILLMAAPLAATELPSPIERRSLPQHWYLREAGGWEKFGATAQTLVYQPVKGRPPLATVFFETRPIGQPMSRDPKAWTPILIPTPPGPFWKMEEPSMTVRAGRKIWRAEMQSDTNSENQHWIVMQATEVDGALLVMSFQQTRNDYKIGLPFVLDLFEHVVPSAAAK